MKVTRDRFDEISEMIKQEEKLAVMMHFAISSHSRMTGQSNASKLHELIDDDFDIHLTNQVLSHLNQKRLMLQQEILKYVTMNFRDEKVFITKRQ